MGLLLYVGFAIAKLSIRKIKWEMGTLFSFFFLTTSFSFSVLGWISLLKIEATDDHYEKSLNVLGMKLLTAHMDKNLLIRFLPEYWGQREKATRMAKFWCERRPRSSLGLARLGVECHRGHVAFDSWSGRGKGGCFKTKDVQGKNETVVLQKDLPCALPLKENFLCNTSMILILVMS